MTAYGSATLTVPLGRFSVELHAVNRRHLEVHNHLSADLMRFDPEIRKWIGAKVLRGYITVKVCVHYALGASIAIKPNLALAAQYKAAWEAIAQKLETQESFQLSFLKNVEELFEEEVRSKEETVLKESLRQVFDQALEKLLEMRILEGAAIKEDISQRLKKIEEVATEIEILGSQAVDKFSTKLHDKLKEFFEGSEHEERVLREICIYAEKVDTAEELVRLKSHIKQFLELLENPPESVGKTLDFLIQEMQREINTIGSKASDLKVSQLVIAVKSELERIREQIQNVE